MRGRPPVSIHLEGRTVFKSEGGSLCRIEFSDGSFGTASANSRQEQFESRFGWFNSDACFCIVKQVIRNAGPSVVRFAAFAQFGCGEFDGR